MYHKTRFMRAPYRVVQTEPVWCEPRHRRVEASSVGLKADILNITYDYTCQLITVNSATQRYVMTR